MQAQESATLWNVPGLNGGGLNLLRAHFITYAFKRHMHDYFAIGLIEAGAQKFTYGRSEKYFTPPMGIIVLNPGDAHTGEAAAAAGFQYRAFYPDADTMQQIASEVRGRNQDIPFFREPVIQDPSLFHTMRRMHVSLESAVSTLEHESRFLWALAQLIVRHAEFRPALDDISLEKPEIRRLRRYIEDHYADDIKLGDLAALVNWSPFHLLRVFRNSVGLPPHAYLETIRIRESQKMLRRGEPIIDVAYASGFGSQSHFTTSFKRLIGVTPGQYAKESNVSD